MALEQRLGAGALCRAIIDALMAFEKVQRAFHPLLISRLHERLIPLVGPLEKALFDIGSTGETLDSGALRRAAHLIIEAVNLFGRSEDIRQGMVNALRASRKVCRAQEMVYPLRSEFPLINGFFLEPQVRDTADRLDPVRTVSDDPVGIEHTGLDGEMYARAGSSLYVPESYDGSPGWPLVVALHGGFGHGRDFLWTWLREARSRRFILLAPNSGGETWSLGRPEVDLEPLVRTVGDLVRRYRVDEGRILLTGMSDGATFALLCCLRGQTPFTACAPVSGVLASPDLPRLTGRRIFWVHGAHDWMFPAERAIQGSRVLSEAGADVTLRIIQDLAHAYPREENDAVLAWFDPSLSLARH